MEELVWILGGIGAVLLLWFWWAKQTRANRHAILARILDRVGGSLEGAGPFADEVLGTHNERAFRLTLSTRPTFRLSNTYPLTASVQLQHAPAINLRIRRDEGLAAVEKKLGLVRDVEVAGGEAFDERYLVEADSAPAHSPLADEDVRVAVDMLLSKWDLDEVRIQNGWLTASGNSRRLGQKMIHEMLYELEVLAHAYDRRPALEIGVQERFFWVGGSDRNPRCPFCHDEIVQLDDFSSCAVCNTLLHPECHEENGGCPILGCGGRGFDHVRPLRVPEK